MSRLTEEEKRFYLKERTSNDTVQADNDRRGNSKSISFGFVIISILLIGIGVLMIGVGFDRGSTSLAEAYSRVKKQTAKEVENRFYKQSYDMAEKTHHVSNRASISISNLKQIETLEVLKVWSVDYQINGKNGDRESNSNIIGKILPSSEDESWLEVPGYGVFTVDLRAAEYIVDDERHYVLARIPKPELTEFTIDTKSIHSLLYKEQGLNRSIQKGVDIAREQIKNAELAMLEKTKAKQEYYKSAQDGAKVLLSNMITELNSDIDDLEVEVEFIKTE